MPSGGIDHHAQQGNLIDITEQFQREFWEETGISVTEIKSIHPFLLVHDRSTHIYEICAAIEKPVKHTAEFVRSLFLMNAWN